MSGGRPGRKRGFSPTIVPPPSPPSLGPWRYFRLTITEWYVASSASTTGAARIAELEYYVDATAHPTSNLTSATTPSPYVVTVSSEEGAHAGWEAFDGNTGDSNQWQSLAGTTTAGQHWIQLDVGSGTEIDPTSYQIAPDSNASSGYYPSAWRLEASNTDQWLGEQVLLDQRSGVTTGWSNNTLRSFSISSQTAVGDAHRYWRITNIQLGAGGDYLEISELQMLEGTTNLTGSATKTSSTAPLGSSGGGLSDLFDGSTGTRCYWTSATIHTGQSFWIKFDFGSDQVVDGVKQGGFDTSSRYMAQFTLEYSDDDTNWTAYGTQTGLTYPGNSTLSSTYSFL